MIDDIIQCLRAIVEGRTIDAIIEPISSSIVRIQIAAVQRRLAHREYQSAFFLEHHIGGSRQ
jgi:hypothetical protein